MWKWIRIPKGLALLSFFLPWLTVSCSRQKVAEASGIDLIHGISTIAGKQVDQISLFGPNLWLAGALFFVIGGLYFSIKSAEAPKDILITSLSAITLIFIGVSRYSRQNIIDSANKDYYKNIIEAFSIGIFQIDWQIGYWLAIGSLSCACGIAAIMLTDKK